MILATFILTIKFLTPQKIGYMKVNQQTTRNYHLLSLQLLKATRLRQGKETGKVRLKHSSLNANSSINLLEKTTLNLEKLNMRKKLSLYNTDSFKQIKNFPLFENEANKIIKIATTLPKTKRRYLMKLLRNNVDIFS